MQGRCRKCGYQIHFENGVWQDNGGGDVCSGNKPHEDVFSEQWFYGFAFANADDTQPPKPVTDTAYLDGHAVGCYRPLEGVMFRCDIAPGGKLVVTVAEQSQAYFKGLDPCWLEKAQEYAEQHDVFSELETGGEDVSLGAAPSAWIPILWHMLGAGPGKKKGQRGRRNRYAASPDSEPCQHLLDMRKVGLVVGGRPMGPELDSLLLFGATVAGCRLIGLSKLETKYATED